MELLDFIVSFENSLRGSVKLPSSFLQLSLQLINFSLHFLFHLLCTTLKIFSFLPELFYKFINLCLKICSHCFKIVRHIFLHFLKSLFIIFNDGVFLLTEQVIHFFSLILMILFHLQLHFLVSLHKFFYFCLELAYEITT